MAIKKLSENTINLIAAGEVVERPASVVKELVENSIDAGATVIDIHLEEAGKNLISISDNGCGMSYEDMLLAVERHTTSKLDEEDILNIRSFGFRGEALPSIASVSRFSMVSKQLNAAAAFKLEFKGAVPQINETVHTQGTRIEVADLFYTVPARLKFLKSNQTELAACVEVVKKLALTSYNIAFSLRHGDRVLLNLPKADDIKTRILDILNQDFVQNSIEISKSNQELNIYGYIGLPTCHRATADEQFIFVNNRPVKDKLVSGSIKAAYQDYVVQGRFPSLVLFIEVPPRFVDVNVHPAKSQVRFQDGAQVRASIVGSIKAAIASSRPATDSSLVNKAFSYIAPSQQYQPRQEQQFFEQTQRYIYQPQPVVLPKNYEDKPFVDDDLLATSATEAEAEVLAALDADGLGFPCAQLHSNYIVAQTQDGVVIVDQHAAHERIVYEELKRRLAKGGIAGQSLLIPIAVELSMDKIASLIEHKEQLAQLGLKFLGVSEVKVVIEEVPAMLVNSDIKQLVIDIADEISQDGQEFSLTKFIEHVVETYACHHSIRSGQKLSIEQMNQLLRQMEQTPGSSQCCHGRPTYVRLTLKQMERLFSRR